MDIDLLMQSFAFQISRRSGILTEDSIRFYLFKCMLEQDDDLNHYTLELPYQSMLEGTECITIPNENHLRKVGTKLYQELDMLYNAGDEAVCIEIKFHRHTNDVSFPHPDAAGTLFNDIQRLSLIHPISNDGKIKRLFLYVTDSEMNKYLSNNKDEYREGLNDFYNAKCEQGPLSISFGTSSAPKVFIHSANKSFENVDTTINSFMISCKSVWREKEGYSCASPSIQEIGQSRPCYIRLFEIFTIGFKGSSIY